MPGKRKKIAIVGGGIAGIVASLRLAEMGHAVTLVEKTNRIGGLLNSSGFDGVGNFDYGTHFACETENRDLNETLFATEDNNIFNFYDRLHAGNYFSGKLNEDSPSIDLRCLSKERYQNCVLDLFEFDEDQVPPANLLDELETRFGKSITREVFKPLMQKFCGVELSELAPRSHTYFDIFRVIALNPSISRLLKQLPQLDVRLSFHSSAEGVNPLRACYPKSQGLCHWITLLERRLKQLDVRIVLNKRVTRVICSGDRISALRMGNETLDADHVVWTIAPFWLLTLARNPCNSEKPALLSTSLHHFAFRKPFRSKSFYITCYDWTLQTFRVTLYPNFVSDGANGLYSCTVEVLHREPTNLQLTQKQILGELKQMGLVDGELEPVFASSELVAEGFPLPTLAFVNIRDEQRKQAAMAFSNVTLSGRATGECFFMRDVMTSTFDQVSHIQ